MAAPGTGEDIYSNLLQYQTQLHSKSAGAVHNFLDSNLDQIAKVVFFNKTSKLSNTNGFYIQVRQSLEALSTLLVSDSNTITPPADNTNVRDGATS